MSTANKSPAKVEPPANPDKALARLVEEFGPKALAKVEEISKAFKLAEGVKRVRALVLQVAPQIMPLQGTPLGFRTDKDKDGGYPLAVVAECATEALLRGLRLHGNEWNIIGGRCYVAQAGVARLVAELEGVTDLEHQPGVPVMRDGGAIVEYTVTWRLNGQPMQLTRKIPVRVNAGMGVDAILGKAKRKALAAVHERLTGSVLTDGEADDRAIVPEQSKPASLTERIRTNLTPQQSQQAVSQAVDQFGNPLDLTEPPTETLFGNPPTNMPD